MNTPEFLSFFPGFRYQTLDDKSMKGAVPKRLAIKRLQTFHPSTWYTDEKLSNMNMEGAGIFFTPNNFSNANRRLASNCIGVNAWFTESDSGTKESQMERIKKNSFLEPSFIVETSSSLHTYWLAKDASISNFRRIQEKLIHYFNGDKAIKDI